MHSLSRTRAFTPVFDGLCGRGDDVARAFATHSLLLLPGFPVAYGLSEAR